MCFSANIMSLQTTILSKRRQSSKLCLQMSSVMSVIHQGLMLQEQREKLNGKSPYQAVVQVSAEE